MEQETVQYTCHKKIAYTGFIGAIFAVAIVETIGVSFLLYKWNMWVHLLHLLINVVFLIGLFIDTKKVVNRPIWVRDGVVHLEVGLRSKIRIPIHQIETIVAGSVLYEEKKKETDTLDLSLFVMEDPTLAIQLKNPIPYRSWFGKTKEARCVFFFIDQPEQFIAQWKKETNA